MAGPADGGGERGTPIRLGGHTRAIDGSVLTWSEAEGTRGTRWREAVERDGHLVRSLLLETSREGRPIRLEVTSAAGLLTLHPEPDESALHGNVVTADGIRHLALAWSPDHELAVEGSPACIAAMVRRLRVSTSIGDEREVRVVVVDDELLPQAGRLLIHRHDERGWAVIDPDTGMAERYTTDASGRPVLHAATTWPLEE